MPVGVLSLSLLLDPPGFLSLSYFSCSHRSALYSGDLLTGLLLEAIRSASLIWRRISLCFRVSRSFSFSLYRPFFFFSFFSFFLFFLRLSPSESSSVDVSLNSSSESISDDFSLSELALSRSSSDISSISSLETSTSSDSSSSLTLSKSSFFALLTLICCLLISPSAFFFSFITSFSRISFTLALRLVVSFFFPFFLASFLAASRITFPKLLISSFDLLVASTYNLIVRKSLSQLLARESMFKN